MEIKASADPKIVEMFRRLEQFLDSEGLTEKKIIELQNAETGRVFAAFVNPESFYALVGERNGLKSTLDEIKDLLLEGASVIDDLELENDRLLDIIDSQNEVLQGRVILDKKFEDEAEVGEENSGSFQWTKEWLETLKGEVLRPRFGESRGAIAWLDAWLDLFIDAILSSCSPSTEDGAAPETVDGDSVVAAFEFIRNEVVGNAYDDVHPFTADVAAARGL